MNIEAFIPPEAPYPFLGLIPLLPLIGSLLVFLSTRWSKDSHFGSGWIATILAFGSFVVAINSYIVLSAEEIDAIYYEGWLWIAVEPLRVPIALRFDNLSAVMTLVVTGVGTLIHLYAIGYMAHDEHRPRFFCYLNLFLFAMLVLVLGDNLLMMFVGWEGVGLCSYLLIGFWFSEMPNAVAGQKAFVVNRIGDAGFLLGIFTLFVYTGSFGFPSGEAISNIHPGVIEIIALLLFVGAVGKSAQIPLYIWLPDAMAGPTPVSALIHAATMVTAGVYMITRMGILYVAAPNTLVIILVIGTLTAFMAATIALVQNDIKRVLAYSTVSQLGFMFMALGSGAFSNGIYHVVTHAFFKACLFMAAGSVIIGCHHEQDMRHYGGLLKKMPLTGITYLLATLAIAGFPYTAGFYSKDAILWTVYSQNNPAASILIFGKPLSVICWGIGAVTALLTAFYMTRSVMLTFFGKYRGHAHPHESPFVVTLPLIILAALSIVFGHLYGEALMHYLGDWTRPDMKVSHEALLKNETYVFLEHLSMGIAVGGILLAILCYSLLSGLPAWFSRTFSGAYNLLNNKYFVDEFYDLTIGRPLASLSRFFFSGIDVNVIDASVNGSAHVVEASGDLSRQTQTGKISHYAALMFIGSVILIVFWLLL